MRHRYSLFGVAISILILSCTKEAELTEVLGPNSGDEVEFYALWADGEAESRTVLQEDGQSIWWSAYDNISVYSDSTDLGIFTSTNSTPAPITKFRGGKLAETGPDGNSNTKPEYWAIYPPLYYNYNISFDGQGVILPVSAVQSATKPGSFAWGLYPAIAHSRDFNLEFYNVCGGARFSVTQEGVMSVVFKSRDGSPLAGTIRVGFGEDSKPIILDISEGVDSVVVNAPSAGFIPGKPYFAVLLPCTHKDGLEVTLYKYFSFATKELSNEISVKRSVFGILDNLDEGLEYSQAEYTRAFEEFINKNSIPKQMVAAGTAGYGQDHWDFGIGAIHLATENMLEDFVTGAENPYYNRFYPWAMCQYQDARYIYCAYFWDCYYKWIKACNDVIGAITSAGEPSAASAPLLGQAYAYRASFYLDLARLFEPKVNRYIDVSAVLGLTVPIITEATASDNNPRAKRADLYKFILDDLDRAAQYLEGTDLPYTVPGLDAVNGLRARAYLEMGAAGDAGAYEKAYEYAGKVIEAGYSALTQAQWEDPVNGFNNGAANNSWIWGVGITAENFDNIITYAAFACTQGLWGYGVLAQFCASRSFYEAIPNNDFRKHSWVDPLGMFFYKYNLSGTTAEQSIFLNGDSYNGCPMACGYESIKFRPAGGNCSDYIVGNAVDQCMMRVEEMQFIQMEALAQTDLAGAKKLLEDFMATRYTNGTYGCSASNKDSFLKEMLFQKRVEFWGEGILIFDYKRLDQGITRGYARTNWPSEWCFNCEGRSPQWNIVIPDSEISRNEGISEEQNNPDPSHFAPLWTLQ